MIFIRLNLKGEQLTPEDKIKLGEYINSLISPSNIEYICLMLYSLNSIIHAYLEKRINRVKIKSEYKNSKIISQFKTDKEKYDNIKEDLSNINNKTTTSGRQYLHIK